MSKKLINAEMRVRSWLKVYNHDRNEMIEAVDTLPAEELRTTKAAPRPKGNMTREDARLVIDRLNGANY